uniref:Sec-independent protein translocase component TatC n=1 Tax=Gracilaria caudata TaxID=2572395 RepID=A0A345UB28_9FLOR|nr:Sec-independent protein translocase component TatC [Gracilaria caudata]AXI97664.1 Sec-independent protein translocase component TatC [Gracilaria caudata]
MYHKLIYFYSVEFFFRLFYIFVSFFLCIIVASLNTYYLILFEVYPFVTYELKKFIVTNIMDLFDMIWYLVISQSFFFVFPYWIFQLYKFSSSSWYLYQLKFFKKSFYFSFSLTFLSLSLIHFGLLPFILYFLTKWEVKNDDLFSIFVEFRVISYINWVLTFRYFLGSLIFLIFLVILHLWFLMKINYIYFLIKHYRKSFIFGILCILFLVTPPDGFLQGFFLILIFLIFETVFLFVCYKLCSIRFLKYANF